MGVPAFFRWLCARNPQFILDAHENYEQFDVESNNPEIDNLYLDMNGIIHPCCRSDGSVVPIAHTIQDMFNNIFLYVDKLMDICRPKKVLYMAIDGVAPRAKMNQQRARRFKGAKEAVELQQKKEELLNEFRERSEINDDVLAFVQNRFDTNVITPGTAFMRDLSMALQHYVIERMNKHPLFKDIKVIFSDASIPGEGEHKILDFIRVQRNQQNYDPNTKHCLYGADADLIMLGLSTHEPYFYIIREQIITQEEKRCSICQQTGHFQMDCPNEMAVEAGQKPVSQKILQAQEQKVRKGITQNFQFAKLYVMRQYLNMRFSKVLFNENLECKLKMKYDIERIIDDFVFMCFFVGNDFLPHIPNLSIRDGGIDALLTLYDNTITQVDDYLTCNGELNLKQVAKLLENMAIVEEDLMKFRKDKEDRDKKNQEINKEKEARLQELRPHISEEEYQKKRKEWRLKEEKKVDIINNESLLQRFKRILSERNNEAKTIKEVKESTQVTLNYNYKLSYYNDKFGVKPQDFIQMQWIIKQSYIEALCWNFAYYYKGCISWSWYYPFHYSPFASDLIDIDQHIIEFERGEPFKPFYQLLSVFPPASALSVPECFRPLMIEPTSEIADFYPIDFYVDLIGKKFEWLGEVILPFIEEERLLKAARKYEHLLSPEEKQRNTAGKIQIFYNQTSINYPLELNQVEHNITGVLDSNCNFSINGPINLLDPQLNLKRVTLNNVQCRYITFPEFEKHDIQLLQGLIEPVEEISESYIEKADMRTYQGENVIKLISRILRGQDDRQPWQKINDERNNYEYGRSQYGNSLNYREMMKHQDQMSSLSSGFNQNNNDQQQRNDQYQQQDGTSNNIFSSLEERQPRYQRYNNGRNQYNNNNYRNNQYNNGNNKNYQGGNYQRNNSNQQYNNSNDGNYNRNYNNNNYNNQYNNNNNYNNNRNDGYQRGQSNQNNRRFNNGNQYQGSGIDLNNVNQIRSQYQNQQQYQQNFQNQPQQPVQQSNLKIFEPAQATQPKIQAPSYINQFQFKQNQPPPPPPNKIYEPDLSQNDGNQEYDPLEAIKKQFKKD
ncbi:hypothetical protein ABPG74_003457 [Tetrahymena malaccensis]